MLALILSPAGFFLVIATYAAGALGALLLDKYDRPANLWGNLFAIAGSVLGILFSGAVLITGTFPAFGIPTSFPLLSLSFRIDYLSAFFMLLISFIALFCSIYALGYAGHFYRKYPLGALGFFYNTFIAGMILVVTAHHALCFLLVWEIMSLTSYFLVIYERREAENIKAGSLYFIMTHIGTAFILFAFLLMYGATGSFDFGEIGNGMAAAPQSLRNAVFVFAIIGFGAKAGIIPFHIWLPAAHPAAPSHVSALMSGVMIKTGIYMLARMGWDMMPGPPPLWWGLLVLICGSISSLLGVLYALSEHDLKRLLAYHSIENIGIILLGLGSSLVFLSAGLKTLALLGLIAALYHTLNHATFKALLFLGAGAVIAQTRTRNIEAYGGLIKVMPQTAFFFLAGSLAISALPPFNGFFSEWMTFQSLFVGISTFSLATKVIFLLATGALAFTGGLAAACFVKAFGVTFLARPRSAAVEPCEGVPPVVEDRNGGSGAQHPAPRVGFRRRFPRVCRNRRVVVRFSARGGPSRGLVRHHDRQHRVRLGIPAGAFCGGRRHNRGDRPGFSSSHAETADHRRLYLGLRRRSHGADGDHRDRFFPIDRHRF